MKNEKQTYEFIKWEIPEKNWKSFSWVDKLKIIILFKVILPKSKLVIKK